jgi:hypothetical protein
MTEASKVRSPPRLHVPLRHILRWCLLPFSHLCDLPPPSRRNAARLVFPRVPGLRPKEFRFRCLLPAVHCDSG